MKGGERVTFKSREDLNDFYDEKMKNSYKQYKQEGKNPYENTLLKSYLIEVHIDDSKGKYHDNSVRRLDEILRNHNGSLKVSETEDESILAISGGRIDFHVDILNKRFWTLHSFSHAKDTDKLRNEILRNVYFDNVWIPSSFFKKINQAYNVYGVNINFYDSFTSDRFFSEEKEEVNLVFQKGYTKEIIKMLEDTEMFKNKFSISKLQILKSSKDNSFVIDDVKFDGKVTVKGNSFIEHISTLEIIGSNYQKIIYEIEDEMTFRVDNDGLMGTPIDILLSRENLNLNKLLELMFSASDPFKLWGITELIDENFARVQAVDLHTGNRGNKINFEITPKLIRVYLPKGSCGNSILRLITNLNRYVDATVDVRGNGSSDLFSITF